MPFNIYFLRIKPKNTGLYCPWISTGQSRNGWWKWLNRTNRYASHCKVRWLKITVSEQHNVFNCNNSFHSKKRQKGFVLPSEISHKFIPSRMTTVYESALLFRHEFACFQSYSYPCAVISQLAHPGKSTAKPTLKHLWIQQSTAILFPDTLWSAVILHRHFTSMQAWVLALRKLQPILNTLFYGSYFL